MSEAYTCTCSSEVVRATRGALWSQRAVSTSSTMFPRAGCPTCRPGRRAARRPANCRSASDTRGPSTTTGASRSGHPRGCPEPPNRGRRRSSCGCGAGCHARCQPGGGASPAAATAADATRSSSLAGAATMRRGWTSGILRRYGLVGCSLPVRLMSCFNLRIWCIFLLYYNWMGGNPRVVPVFFLVTATIICFSVFPSAFLHLLAPLCGVATSVRPVALTYSRAAKFVLYHSVFACLFTGAHTYSGCTRYGA